MNRWVRRGINFTLFLIAFNTIEHWCHQKTKGFYLERIQFHGGKTEISAADAATVSRLNLETAVRDGKVMQVFESELVPTEGNIPQMVPNSEDPSVGNDSGSKDCVNLPSPTAVSRLNQPFHYLNHGNQCFAFISEDGKYILKFFKYVHPASPVWISKIPLLNRFKAFRQTRIDKVTWKRTRDFQGYQVAFDHFRNETGLLAIHFHPTENYPTITLYDPLNIVHSLDLNHTPFILQKRATPIFEQFSSWIQKGEIDKLQRGISDLISLCAHRISKHIFDDDVNFYSNFGFANEKPIQIDPGHFILNSSNTSELPTLVIELKEWFSKNYPPMVSHVEACANSH